VRGVWRVGAEGVPADGDEMSVGKALELLVAAAA